MKAALIIVLVLAAVAVGAVLYLKYGSFGGRNEAAAPVPTAWLLYSTGSDFAPYGNFSFEYPSGLALAKDYIVNSSGTKRHALVLVDRNLIISAPISAIPKNAPNQVFVNVSSCSSYEQCSEVQGVPIGTNSTDTAFLGLVGELTANFKVASGTNSQQGR